MPTENTSAAKRSYGALAAQLAAELASIEPSRDGSLEYRPCSVTLGDGVVIPNAYIVDAQQYIDVWGVWPEDDPGKSSVPLAAVKAIVPSPNRLPASMASELYRAGESGMGYTVFKLHFSDGTTESYATGNAVDFVSYPSGKSGDHITRVESHVGRNESPRRAPDYSWILYGTGEARHVFDRFSDA